MSFHLQLCLADFSAKGPRIMDQALRRQQNFLLRLPNTLRENAIRTARDEGTSLNQFITIAVAEKLSRMGRDDISYATTAEKSPGWPMPGLR